MNMQKLATLLVVGYFVRQAICGFMILCLVGWIYASQT